MRYNVRVLGLYMTKLRKVGSTRVVNHVGTVALHLHRSGQSIRIKGAEQDTGEAQEVQKKVAPTF